MKPGSANTQRNPGHSCLTFKQEAAKVQERLDEIQLVNNILIGTRLSTPSSIDMQRKTLHTIHLELIEQFDRLARLEGDIAGDPEFGEPDADGRARADADDRLREIGALSKALITERMAICRASPEALKELAHFEYATSFLRLTGHSGRTFGVEAPPLGPAAARLDEISQRLRALHAAVREIDFSLETEGRKPVAEKDKIPPRVRAAGHGRTRAALQADDKFFVTYPLHARIATSMAPGTNNGKLCPPP